jgi:hypothetical protein
MNLSNSIQVDMSLTSPPYNIGKAMEIPKIIISLENILILLIL